MLAPAHRVCPREFRALDRRNWYLAVARLIVTAGFSMVLPFLGVYLTRDRGAPAKFAGLIWALAGAMRSRHAVGGRNRVRSHRPARR